MTPTQLRSIILPPLLGLALIQGACGEKPQDQVTQQAPEDTVAAPPQQAAAAVEQGMFFKPDLKGFAPHNEEDADGDGDGIKETHVRRYINEQGDSAFSMTTNERLWAWSLDTKGGDDADIHLNYVIRDSNCDGVFDERYSLDAEFRLPACLFQEGSAEGQGGV